MIHRMASLFTVLALLAVLLAGCNLGKGKSPSLNESSAPAEYPVTVNGVELKQAPARVAVLSPSLAEIVGDMGYGASVIGRSQECDKPAAIASLPDAGSMLMPVMPVLMSWNPDLVLMQTTPSDAVKTQLEAKSIPFIVVPAASAFDGLKELYTTIGQIFSGLVTGSAKGAEQMAKLTDSLNAITQKVTAEAAGTPVKAVYVTDAFGHVATGETIMNRLITAAGLTNAAAAASNWSATEEQVASADVLFCPDTLVDKVKALSAFSNTPAVKNGRVYGISAPSMERQSGSMASAAESMAKAAYPTAFENETTAPSAATTASAASATAG